MKPYRGHGIRGAIGRRNMTDKDLKKKKPIYLLGSLTFEFSFFKCTIFAPINVFFIYDVCSIQIIVR